MSYILQYLSTKLYYLSNMFKHLYRPEPPGAARSRPEPPGAARRFRRGYRWGFRPEPPGAARSRPEPPGAARRGLGVWGKN